MWNFLESNNYFSKTITRHGKHDYRRTVSARSQNNERPSVKTAVLADILDDCSSSAGARVLRAGNTDI
jgi:hypothetical protein